MRPINGIDVYVTMDIPAYTFRSKYLFQAGILSKDIR